LDWLTVVTISGVMAMKIKHVADKVPAFIKYLRTFGEAGVVKIAGTVKVKVDMHGILCMMGDYCTDQVGDCYKMYDPINNNVYLARDVLWFNRIYFGKDGKVDSLPDVSADAAPAASALTEGRCTYLRLSHISYYIARMGAQLQLRLQVLLDPIEFSYTRYHSTRDI
jgi:hypothetical protein